MGSDPSHAAGRKRHDDSCCAGGVRPISPPELPRLLADAQRHFAQAELFSRNATNREIHELLKRPGSYGQLGMFGPFAFFIEPQNRIGPYLAQSKAPSD